MSDDLTPEQIAVAAMRSEAMLWLMSGSNHPEAQLATLRVYWAKYIAAGGSTWGKPRKPLPGPEADAEAINPAPTNEDKGQPAESISAPPCSGGVLPTPKDVNTSLIGGPSCNTRFDKIPDGHAELDDWPRILGMNGMVWE